jgi:endonuclease/exonuclease/phosphatase family metal-dependent hydrolase
MRCASSAEYSSPRKKTSRANFWPDLAGEVGRAEAAVEAADVGVGLLERGVLGAGQGEVGDDVQAVPAAGRPPGDDADDHLGHEADQPLRLQHVQPPARPGAVLVAVPPAHPLVATGAERPAAVLRARAVAGEQHAADVGGQPGVLQRGDQLVDGLRAEGVAHLGPVEGDPDDAGVDGPVVGDVGEVEPLDRLPRRAVEDLGDVVAGGHDPNLAPGPAAHGRSPPTRAGTVAGVADAPAVRVGTVNIASGRTPAGPVLDAPGLEKAVAGLDVDVLAVQEVDAGQPRSHRTDQAAALATGLGAEDWRGAATVAGTPDPFRSWTPAGPLLRGPHTPADGPLYGIALLSRLPVLEWSVLDLGTGRARLPVQGLDPRTGRLRRWWFPDEPRAAVAARLESLTVVSTHLSFAPHTAVRQLLRLRRWIAGMPGPVVLAGDLNLPGACPPGCSVPPRWCVPRASRRPAHGVQLDHLLAVGDGLRGRDAATTVLPVGDHRALTVTVTPA